MTASQLLLISGSLREGSTNSTVLETVAALVPTGVSTTLYRGMEQLPHFNPDDDREGEPVNDHVAALRAEVASADALLICTPEYAGALPGALKNLLEWTVGDAGTYGKPVAFINAAGPASPTGAADAHDSLRKVLGYVGAEIVEDACLRVPVTRDMLGADGTISDSSARSAIAGAVQDLVNGIHTLSTQAEPESNPTTSD
jgi:chromate reductase